MTMTMAFFHHGCGSIGHALYAAPCSFRERAGDPHSNWDTCKGICVTLGPHATGLSPGLS